MASQSRSEAARVNGAKSHGPSTPEGKSRSSRNALKHGLTAEFHALPGESEEALEDLIAAYQTQHQPVGAIEAELVRSLAVVRWRLNRIAVLETHLFENELCLSEEQIDKEYAEIDDLGRLAFVFQKLADGGQALTLLMRYESSLTRIYDRTFKHLLNIQKLRNEPKPPTMPPDGTASPGNQEENQSRNRQPHTMDRDNVPIARSPIAHRKWFGCPPLTTASPVSASHSPDGRSSAATNYGRR
jgi:hypothetical protein